MKITPTSNQRPLILDVKSSTDREFLSQLISRTPCRHTFRKRYVFCSHSISKFQEYYLELGIWSISHYFKTGDVDDILSLGEIGHRARFFQSRILSVKYWWVLKFQYYHGYKWALWILNKERKDSSFCQETISGTRNDDIYKRFFLIPKTPIHLTFRSYYEIELNRIIKMYYSVEIPLKLESEPWSQQSFFDIRNGKPNVTSLLTKLGESRKKSSTISVNFI